MISKISVENFKSFDQAVENDHDLIVKDSHEGGSPGTGRK